MWPEMSLTAGTRLGPYEITGALGTGGMGEVYRARDPRLGREVAVKALPELLQANPERVRRFQREAQILASLNHPHIAAIYGLEEVGPAQFLILELVEGQTLADRLKGGRPALGEALRIARQIADGLQAAHDRGIVHRDLKPANIALTPQGDAKVLDFGLAKAFEADGAGEAGEGPTITSAETRDGVVLGTAAYMSPEQARGRPIDRGDSVGYPGRDPRAGAGLAPAAAGHSRPDRLAAPPVSREGPTQAAARYC
jgi:eukaryotic-like serine/threonine-protein kinase